MSQSCTSLGWLPQPPSATHGSDSSPPLCTSSAADISTPLWHEGEHHIDPVPPSSNAHVFGGMESPAVSCDASTSATCVNCGAPGASTKHPAATTAAAKTRKTLITTPPYYVLRKLKRIREERPRLLTGSLSCPPPPAGRDPTRDGPHHSPCIRQHERQRRSSAPLPTKNPRYPCRCGTAQHHERSNRTGVNLYCRFSPVKTSVWGIKKKAHRVGIKTPSHGSAKCPVYHHRCANTVSDVRRPTLLSRASILLPLDARCNQPLTSTSRTANRVRSAASWTWSFFMSCHL